MIERLVDFNQMAEGGKFFFTLAQPVTPQESEQGVLLKDELGNTCQARFAGIQSQRGYTLCSVVLLPETWHGAFPPEKVRELKSI